MSSTRLRYDGCKFNLEYGIRGSNRNQLDYNLYPGAFENCFQCPSVGNYPNILPFGKRADVESELRNQTRLSTLCPRYKYNPCRDFQGYKTNPPTICQNIYGITPNNLPSAKDMNRGFNDAGLGRMCCPTPRNN
jgi:hypothetical protein